MKRDNRLQKRNFCGKLIVDNPVCPLLPVAYIKILVAMTKASSLEVTDGHVRIAHGGIPRAIATMVKGDICGQIGRKV